jgi:hypothetical protein
MIRQIAANLVLGVVLVSALVLYAPNPLQPQFGSISGAFQHRFEQTNCWGYDEEWDCSTESRFVPA